MRTTIVAMLVASGAMIALPAVAQQHSAPNQQMQDKADKGVKTRNSGESGYVVDQEKPGSSAHAPGRPDTAPRRGSTWDLPRDDKQRSQAAVTGQAELSIGW